MANVVGPDGIKTLIQLIKGDNEAIGSPNIGEDSNNNIIHGQNNRVYIEGEEGLGNNNLVSGQDNVVLGDNNFVTGTGNIIEESTLNQLIIGQYNSPNQDAALIIGNGTSEEGRTNSFLVNKNGNIATSGAEINAKNATLTIKELNIGNKTLDLILAEENNETLINANAYTDEKVSENLPALAEEQAIDNTYILAANTDDSIEMPELDGISFKEENGITNIVLSCSSFDNLDIQQAQQKTRVVVELKDEKGNLINKSLEKILRIEKSTEIPSNLHFIISNSKKLTSEDLKRIDVNNSSAKFLNPKSHWISIKDQIENSGVKDEILTDAETKTTELINANNTTFLKENIVTRFTEAAGKKDKALSADLGYELHAAINDINDRKFVFQEDYIDKKIGNLVYSFDVVSGDSGYNPGITKPEMVYLEDPNFTEIYAIGANRLQFLVIPESELKIQLLGDKESDWLNVPTPVGENKYLTIEEKDILISSNKSDRGESILENLPQDFPIEEFLSIVKTAYAINIQDSKQKSHFLGGTIYIPVENAFIELKHLILPKIEEDIEELNETINNMNTSITTEKLNVTKTINEGANIIGGNNNTVGTGAIRNLVVGYQNIANKNNSIIAGQKNTDNSGNNIISGTGHTISASNIIINGQNCEALIGASSSIINGNQSSAGGPYQIIVGTNCHGFNDKSSGKYQFVLGENLNAQANDTIITQNLRIKKNGDIYQKGILLTPMLSNYSKEDCFYIHSCTTQEKYYINQITILEKDNYIAFQDGIPWIEPSDILSIPVMGDADNPIDDPTGKLLYYENYKIADYQTFEERYCIWISITDSTKILTKNDFYFNTMPINYPFYVIKPSTKLNPKWTTKSELLGDLIARIEKLEQEVIKLGGSIE